ncbi:interleukin-13 receptor subunit alpha-1-like [Brachyistius frenatus]|uniref:interleukin-13 receptor subunit alpha-1-like n=1 Tax=Brachyistius frenatus TaxID=100188 RepID=UPI0037E9836D
MTVTLEFFTFLYTAIITVVYCQADCPFPAPRNLSYRWMDPFTLKLSWFWEKPDNLPPGCEISYELNLENTDTHRVGETLRTESRHFINNCLTEEMGSGQWEFNIQVVSSGSCHGWNSSRRENKIINTPRAEVVKDFQCLLKSNETNCSWIPVDPSLNWTLSYRSCGTTAEDIRSTKECDRPYRSGKRCGCFLKVDAIAKDICVCVKTEAGLNTFKPKLVIPPPKLSIKESGDNLNLTWTTPDVGKYCTWKYMVCYKKCNEDKVCQTFQPIMDTEEHGPMRVPYDRSCLYEFQFNTTSGENCVPVFSNGGANATYGSNKLHDGTLTVVSIVIPVILSVCVILSCYCFRRHRAIICPNIPDPSAIFKEMMVNGNKEHKMATGSLYTPVSEPVEPCKITLLTENGVLQQNT